MENPRKEPEVSYEMSLDDAYEYVSIADESESEQRAEYGSGLVSLGYDASEWMATYDGYLTSTDARYAEAVRIIEAERARRLAEHPANQVVSTADFLVGVDVDAAADDIPF
jgi:hypothetical protein